MDNITNIPRKSKIVALLLCFFLGTLGFHRFYIGKTASGIAMLILDIIGWMTVGFIIGFFPLLIVSLWSLIDFFLILFNKSKDQFGRDLV